MDKALSPTSSENPECLKPIFDVWSFKCLFQLLQEHPPLVVLTRHPGRVDLSPYHKGIVGRNISLPSAAVRFIHPIYPHPLVLLWDSTCRLPVVDLHLPSVAGLGVTGHSWLDPIFCWLAGHILRERTTSFGQKRFASVISIRVTEINSENHLQWGK